MVARRSYYIDAPVETVFDFMKTMKWRDVALMEVRDVSMTEDGLGTSFGWSFKVAGLRFAGFDVFTEVVPNQRITQRSAGAIPGAMVHTFEPEGTGTRWAIEFRPGSFWRIPPLNRLLEFGLVRMGATGMPRFKESAEALSRGLEPAPDGQRKAEPAAQAPRALRQSIHIEAPVERVFGSIQDPTTWRKIMDSDFHVEDIKITEEGVGTYFSWRTKIAGLPVHGFDVYTDVVPRKHITDRSSSAMVGTWDYDVEPEGSGTKLTLEYHPRSFWRIAPLRGLADLTAAKMSDSVLPRLKDAIETSPA